MLTVVNNNPSTSCIDATPANYAIIVNTSDRPTSLTIFNNDASTSCVNATPANYAIIVGTSDHPTLLTVVNNDVDVIADIRWLIRQRS